jgi:hypothetical protein
MKIILNLLSNCLASINRDLVQLRADCRGNVTIMMGLLIAPMVGAMGMGFEVSNWYMSKRAMQNAADSSAIAAASNARSNYDIEAKAVAALYGFVDGSNNITVSASNTATCPGGGNTCYSVTIRGLDPLSLSQIVGYQGDATVNGANAKSLSSTAIAISSQVKQPICLLALSQTGTALRTNGAPNSNFTGCSVMSNSGASCNGSNLSANYGLASGTNSGCGNNEQSNIPAVHDPYSAMATNIPTNNCGSYPQEPGKNGTPLPISNQWSGSKSLSGAVQVCGDLQLTGNVMISTPDNTTGAVLVVENGQLDLNGHTLSTADGSAVTIVFSGTAGNYTHAPTDNSTGQGGMLDVQAPSSSAALFQGMAIYQDPSLTAGVDFTYKGNNPDWKISGGVYLPNANVKISGDVSQSTNGADCFVMVASTILINGTSNIYQQSPTGSGCKNAGLNMPTATISARAQLVY